MPPAIPYDELIEAFGDAAHRSVAAARVAPPLGEVIAPTRPQTVAGVTWDSGELIHRCAWLVQERPAPHSAGYRHPALVDHATTVDLVEKWTDECVDALKAADPAEPIAPIEGAVTVGEVAALLCAELLPVATALEHAAGLPLGPSSPEVVESVLRWWAATRLRYDGEKPVVWSGHLTRVRATDTGQEWCWETGLAGGKYGFWVIRPVGPGDVAVEVTGPAEPLLRWLTWRTDEHPEVDVSGDENDITRFRTAVRHPGLPDVKLPLWLRMFGPRTAPYKHGPALERSSLARPEEPKRRR